MAYLRRFALCTLILGSACGSDDPGQSALPPSDTEGTSTGEDPSSSDTTDPDSTSAGEEAWAEICDGSDQMRLAMVLRDGGVVDNEIVREIGSAYLYVRGTCEYWVLPAIDGVLWPDARTGVLDPSAEEELSRVLSYDRLDEIAGTWGADEDDGATLLVSDGTSTVSCYAGCELGPVAARVMWGQLDRLEPLWDNSEPYAGPLRISVVGWANSVIDELGVPWPLERDPWSIAIDGDTEPGSETPSLLIDDPDEVAALRELRRQYREDDLPEGIPNALQAYGHLSFTSEDGQDLFQLWIRDALPLEDEDGAIVLP